MNLPARMAGAVLSMALTSPSGAATSPDAQRLIADWDAYVHAYVQTDGRVVDHMTDGSTTSEGEAYALLRAVWADDREVFDQVLRWTRDNLQGGEATALPAWKWGARDDGTWGVLDAEPAADADLLISYALLLAAKRWHRGAYRRQARGLLDAVWAREVAYAGDKPVLLPGPWAAGLVPLPVNPSYWMPFVFRAAAEVDPKHDWAGLVDTTYELLDALVERHGLPPDWDHLDPETGAWVEPEQATTPGGTQFGWEAVRLPWILEAEVRWFGEPRAISLLDRMAHLGTRFDRDGHLPAVLAAGDQEALAPYGSRVLYASLVPTWARTSPERVPAALRHINILALPTPASPVQGRDYYAENWVWFGMALWSGLATPVESP